MKKLLSVAMLLVMALSVSAQEKVSKWLDLNYAGDTLTGHKLDIYVPNDGKPTHKVIVLVYGSAWFSNNSKVDAYNRVGKTLTNAGFAVVSVNHRASREAHYPAQIQDIKAAIRYVRGNADKYGLDTSFVGITGYSSGGHLSALAGTTNNVKKKKVGHTTFDIEGSIGSFTKFSSSVDAVVDWFGPIDMSRMDGCTDYKKGDSPEAVLLGAPSGDVPEASALLSPMTYLDKRDPKILVIHGDADSVVPYCQSEFFANALKKYGLLEDFITVKDGQHGPVTMNDYTFLRMVNFFRTQAHEKAFDSLPQ